MPSKPAVYEILKRGTVIPAMPLAVTAQRNFDERRQRALVRYYIEAGAGGVAVGVHTTQFEIRQPPYNLLQPVLELVADELNRLEAARGAPLVRVAGICGTSRQAVAEAALARDLGYSAGLFNLSAMRGASVDALIDRCRAVAEIIPLFGFYLQPAVGGLELPYEFWTQLAQIEPLVAIKIAAFDRYRTLDVVRTMAETGRDNVALYTGNDDNIVFDLLTPYRFLIRGKIVERRIVGGLLGHWAVWTRAAVELFDRCRSVAGQNGSISSDLAATAMEVTDCNAALFDAANRFRGCVPGIHEVLRRQGLLEGNWCLDEAHVLSPGQSAELDRVSAAYPHLCDDEFVAAHLDAWLDR